MEKLEVSHSESVKSSEEAPPDSARWVNKPNPWRSGCAGKRLRGVSIHGRSTNRMRFSHRVMPRDVRLPAVLLTAKRGGGQQAQGQRQG